MPQQSTRGVVLRNGLIFGAIIVALITGDTIIEWLTGGYNISSQANGNLTTANIVTSAVEALMGFGIFLGSLALTFFAGLRTARKTGGVGAGAIAGLVAGAFGALVGGTVSLVITIALEAPAIQAPMGSGFTQSQMQGMLISSDVFGSILGLFQFGGFGAGMGALGGLVGKSSYLKANPPQPYQQPFYPGGPWQPGAYYPAAPYPGPQYPGVPYAPQYPGPQYLAPSYAPPLYAGPQYPAAPQFPGQAGSPTAPAQPQEPQPQEPQPPRQQE